MNKADLIEALAPRLGGRAQAASAVESLVDVLLREVAAGGSVGITGFGVFETVERAPRTGRNPRTGEAVPIAGTRSPRFRPAAYFRQVVADPSTLPTDGLAGVRVATHEESERAGAPRTVRRTEPDAAPTTTATRVGSTTSVSGSTATGGVTAPGRDGEEGRDGAAAPPPRAGSRSGTVSSGTPDTVRKVPAEVDAPDPAPAATATVTGRGPVVLAGADITQSMIAAKKAQLARAQDERATRSEQGRGGKASKKAGKGGRPRKKDGKKTKKGGRSTKAGKD